MQRKTSSRFQRILSLLLCAAMVCSYIVLPVGAEAADGVPSEKFSLGVDNIFAYQADEVVLNQGDWVSYRADNGNASLHDFLENEAQQYVDLMPREGKTYWSDAVRETCAKAEFHEDGSVSVVNYYSLPEFSWPYVYTQPSVAIDLELTRWLYFTYEATNYFNVVLDYTYNGTAYSKKPQTSDYSPVSEATTYCVDLHAVTGLTSGKIVLTQCKFYTSGSYGGNVESVDGAGLENGKYRQPVPLNTLSNAGYPQLDNGDGGACALDYLFDGTQTNADGSSALVSTMANGGLFQMDEDGYFYYDSMQNAAYYDETANKFVLMEDLIVRPWYNANDGADYRAGSNYQDYADVAGHATVYGNFLPFNKITEENVTLDGAVYYNASATPDANGNYGSKHAVDESYSALRNVPGSLERYGLGIGAADKVLAGSKARSNSAYADIVAANGGEILSGRIEDQLDMGFGMTVDFDFYQPQGGKFNGGDMQFDFLGDDDVFVYVGIWTGTKYEYRLVLDIGGIHEAKRGNINFATGAVEDWPSSSTAQRTGRSLYQIFLDTDGDGTVSETEAQGELARYFDGEVFADFTKLSLKLLYLERGGNISYCRLRFNMPTLPENSLTVSKALNTNVLGTQSYQFRVLKAVYNEETGEHEATDGLFIPEGTRYTVAGTTRTGTVGAGGYFTRQTMLPAC